MPKQPDQPRWEQVVERNRGDLRVPGVDGQARNQTRTHALGHKTPDGAVVVRSKHDRGFNPASAEMILLRPRPGVASKRCEGKRGKLSISGRPTPVGKRRAGTDHQDVRVAQQLHGFEGPVDERREGGESHVELTHRDARLELLAYALVEEDLHAGPSVLEALEDRGEDPRAHTLEGAHAQEAAVPFA